MGSEDVTIYLTYYFRGLRLNLLKDPVSATLSSACSRPLALFRNLSAAPNIRCYNGTISSQHVLYIVHALEEL